MPKHCGTAIRRHFENPMPVHSGNSMCPMTLVMIGARTFLCRRLRRNALRLLRPTILSRLTTFVLSCAPVRA